MDDFQRGLIELLPRLRRLARVLTPPAADPDNLVQAALERAFRDRSQLRTSATLDAWAFVILKHSWIDASRRRGRRKPRAPRSKSAGPHTASPAADAAAAALREAVWRLPDDQRLAVALVMVEGLSDLEAAAVMEAAPGVLNHRLDGAQASLAAWRRQAEAAAGPTPADGPEPEAASTASRLRQAVSGAFADAALEPPPTRLLATVARAGRPVINFGAGPSRATKTRGGWIFTAGRWGAVAAGLVAAFAAGGLLPARSPAPSGPIEAQSDGGMIARGVLARALRSQLAADQTPGAAVRIGFSFLDRQGAVCRTFILGERWPVAGLACRQPSGWSIRIAVEGKPVLGPLPPTARDQTPGAVLEAVDQIIQGAPLDAAAETRARALGWKLPAPQPG